MNRYPAMFDVLKERGEGAFVPFVMVGDPDPTTSEAVIEALIAGGADALELGVPFTDPVADGPTIQRAHVRALAVGTSFRDCLEVVERVRRRHPQLPIGMLIYGNVPFAMGLERFYDECAQAGIDSVLLPDVPIRESAAFSQAAESVERLRADAAAPVMLGFGISTPEQVSEAIAAGADGAISGSATVKIVERYAPEIVAATSEEHGGPGSEERRHYALGALRSELVAFTAAMKEATRRY